MPTITIEAELHPGQLEVHDHTARFKVLACGRRWGKTRLGVNECLGVAATGRRAWWVAPSYRMSEVGWRPLRFMAGRIPGAEIRKVDRRVTLPGGGTVSVRSADNPDSLRGEGLDFLVVDECAFVLEEAWTEALRPALSDRQGDAMFISTPKGRNWFWRMYQRGVDPANEEWQAWSFPTSDNPYIDGGEIEAAREMLPDLTFRQEYLAEFIDDAGLVFRNIRACVLPELPKYNVNKRYVMGVDWAQQHDFTVLTVMEARSRRVVDMDRFNLIGWDVQRDRLITMAERWDVKHIIAEENSIGGPNIEELQNEGLPVTAFTTTLQSKTDIVKALQLAFEREDIGIPDDPVLLGELQAYEAERLPSGKWRYGAPEGMHDDTVISLALALEAAHASGGPMPVQQVQESKWNVGGRNGRGRYQRGSKWRR